MIEVLIKGQPPRFWPQLQGFWGGYICPNISRIETKLQPQAADAATLSKFSVTALVPISRTGLKLQPHQLRLSQFPVISIMTVAKLQPQVTTLAAFVPISRNV